MFFLYADDVLAPCSNRDAIKSSSLTIESEQPDNSV